MIIVTVITYLFDQKKTETKAKFLTFHGVASDDEVQKMLC